MTAIINNYNKSYIFAIKYIETSPIKKEWILVRRPQTPYENYYFVGFYPIQNFYTPGGNSDSILTFCNKKMAKYLIDKIEKRWKAFSMAFNIIHEYKYEYEVVDYFTLPSIPYLNEDIMLTEQEIDIWAEDKYFIY